VDTGVDLHEHQGMAFPVTDLDAYERRMRQRARFAGVFGIWFGVALWGGRTVGGPTTWSATVAVTVGSIVAVVLWALRNGRYVRLFFVPDRPRSLRDGKTWLLMAAAAIGLVAPYLSMNAVLSAFDIGLTIAAFGAAVWTAVGITAILDAPLFGREQRQRYEADLEELAALRSRPDITPQPDA
jgi:hypothetical protein